MVVKQECTMCKLRKKTSNEKNPQQQKTTQQDLSGPKMGGGGKAHFLSLKIRVKHL